MPDQDPGWTNPESIKLRWYHYTVIAVAAVVGGAFALMIATIIFFGLIAGW